MSNRTKKVVQAKNKMEKGWVKVYSSTRIQDIQLLKHLLEESDIDSVILNQQDSFYVTIGEINLVVRGKDVIRAKKIISESKL